jgi:hypothetical protein
MNRATTFITGAISGLAAVAGWRYYRSRATEQVDYESQRLYDDIEIREYPAVVVAETVADSVGEARGRLESYLAGANESETAIPATTPIRTHTEPLELATPDQQGSATDRIRVGVYLPQSYSPQTAPRPTDRSVALTVETPRTVAVRSVRLYPRVDRFEQAEARLRSTIADCELVAVGSPFVFSYDNAVLGSLTGRAEVAVEIA